MIDMGEALRASVVGFERRKRLLDICVDLPSSKDRVVLAALDDKLVHVVVGISQEITNMEDLLNPANIIVLAVIAAGLFFWIPAYCRIDAWHMLLRRWGGQKEGQEGRGRGHRCVSLSL